MKSGICFLKIYIFWLLPLLIDDCKSHLIGMLFCLMTSLQGMDKARLPGYLMRSQSSTGVADGRGKQFSTVFHVSCGLYSCLAV